MRDEWGSLGSSPRYAATLAACIGHYTPYDAFVRCLLQELGELKHLRVLSMGNNKICGQLPESLGRLKQLQRIVLHQNNLTGTVPPDLWRLGCIVNLAGNVGLIHGADVPTSERFALEEIYRATQGNSWTSKSGDSFISPLITGV